MNTDKPEKPIVRYLPLLLFGVMMVLVAFLLYGGFILRWVPDGKVARVGARMIVGGFLLLCAALLVVLLHARVRRAWIEIGIIVSISFALAVWSLQPVLPVLSDDAEGQIQFQLKTSELDGDVSLFGPNEYRSQPNEYARLVIVQEKAGKEDETTFETTSYHDLRILDLLNASGRSVVSTDTTPESILLSVPSAEFDDMVKRLVDKKAAYLLPQGMAKVAPTASPEPTPAPPTVEFDLPTTKIKSDLAHLKCGDTVAVIVVVERRDTESRTLEHKAHRHDGATLLKVPSGQDCKGPINVRIRLPLDTNGAATEFAAQLADADGIYLVHVPPTPAPTPEE